MKYSRYFLSVLIAVHMVCVQGIAAMGMLTDDADTAGLAQMMRGCVIERRLQVPHNTPELASFDNFTDNVCSWSSYRCKFPGCYCVFSSHGILENHMFDAHQVFLCPCDKRFQDYGDYYDHRTSCRFHS